jgi:hypothetical protein
MPTTTTGLFSALLAPGLRKVWTDEINKWQPEYKDILNELTSTRAWEEELVTAGLGRWEQKLESKNLIYDNGIQGGSKRYTHKSFAKGFRVSREMYDDDLYDVMIKLSRSLATLGQLSVEYEVGSMFDDAFAGATFKGVDSQALCYASHPLLVGGTYGNRPATDCDFGIGPLRDAIIRMEMAVNERGLLQMLKPSYVLVHPTYQFVVDEILGSKNKPYTADNTKNAFDRFNLSYKTYHFMTDDDAWFLMAEKSQHDLKFFSRTKPMFENGDDFDSKDAKFSGFMRFSYGFTSWRGVDGSSGG